MRTGERHLAVDMARPTCIRVKIEHLYPETLDHFNLPWVHDLTDDCYLFIRDYVSHELQRELFCHTRRLKTRHEKLLITDGYVKDTVTTLKPKDVYKDKSSDGMFVVRRKSPASDLDDADKLVVKKVGNREDLMAVTVM